MTDRRKHPWAGYVYASPSIFPISWGNPNPGFGAILRRGQLVTALVVDNEGADLIAEVRSGTVR